MNAPVTQLDIDQRVFDLYDEYCHGRIDRREFLARAPDGLFPAGGYPGNDDDGRALQSGLDQGKLRTDMLNSARVLKSHKLSTGKLGVTGFCWGGGTTNYLATVMGAEMHAGVPYYGAAAATAEVPKIKAPLLIHAVADPVCRERCGHQRHVAGLRGRAQGGRREIRGAHLSRHAARFS